MQTVSNNPMSKVMKKSVKGAAKGVGTIGRVGTDTLQKVGTTILKGSSHLGGFGQSGEDEEAANLAVLVMNSVKGAAKGVETIGRVGTKGVGTIGRVGTDTLQKVGTTILKGSSHLGGFGQSGEDEEAANLAVLLMNSVKGAAKGVETIGRVGTKGVGTIGRVGTDTLQRVSTTILKGSSHLGGFGQIGEDGQIGEAEEAANLAVLLMNSDDHETQIEMETDIWDMPAFDEIIDDSSDDDRKVTRRASRSAISGTKAAKKKKKKKKKSLLNPLDTSQSTVATVESTGSNKGTTKKKKKSKTLNLGSDHGASIKSSKSLNQVGEEKPVKKLKKKRRNSGGALTDKKTKGGYSSDGGLAQKKERLRESKREKMAKRCNSDKAGGNKNEEVPSAPDEELLTPRGSRKIKTTKRRNSGCALADEKKALVEQQSNSESQTKERKDGSNKVSSEDSHQEPSKAQSQSRAAAPEEGTAATPEKKENKLMSLIKLKRDQKAEEKKSDASEGNEIEPEPSHASLIPKLNLKLNLPTIRKTETLRQAEEPVEVEHEKEPESSHHSLLHKMKLKHDSPNTGKTETPREPDAPVEEGNEKEPEPSHNSLFAKMNLKLDLPTIMGKAKTPREAEAPVEEENEKDAPLAEGTEQEAGSQEGDEDGNEPGQASPHTTKSNFALRDLRRFTAKTDSKWNAMRASANFITNTQKGAIFANLFDKEDADVLLPAPSLPAASPVDEDMYVEGDQDANSPSPQQKGVEKRRSSAPITSAEVDDWLAAIERLEMELARERGTMEKEMESVAFERESLELQLDEEAQKNESLNQQLRELKQEQEQEEKFTGAAGKAHELTELSGENEALSAQLKREQSQSEQRMIEKESEIEDLQNTIKNLKMEEKVDVFTVNPNDGKSKQRLQGELLQAIAKLSDRDATITRQNKEITEMRQELDFLQAGDLVQKLKKQMIDIQEEKDELVTKLESGQKETEMKITTKDETIAFLIEELGNMKKAESESKGSYLSSPFRGRGN
jgi:hypothetical protein